jgi:hypothetical protein
VLKPPILCEPKLVRCVCCVCVCVVSVGGIRWLVFDPVSYCKVTSRFKLTNLANVGSPSRSEFSAENFFFCVCAVQEFVLYSKQGQWRVVHQDFDCQQRRNRESDRLLCGCSQLIFCFISLCRHAVLLRPQGKWVSRLSRFTVMRTDTAST